MAGQVQWCIAGRIILEELWNEVTLDDLRATTQQLDRMVGSQPVYVIIDARRASAFPGDLKALSLLMAHPARQHCQVMLVQSKVIGIIMNTLCRMAHLPLKVYDDLALAAPVLRCYDENLPALLGQPAREWCAAQV